MAKKLTPFSIDKTYPIFSKPILKPLGSLINTLLGLNFLNQKYTEYAHYSSPQECTQKMLEAHGIHAKYNSKSLNNIPETGPCIITSNHPTGLCETFVLYHLIQQKRSDVKFLATPLLSGMEAAKDILITVDNLNSSTAHETNLKAIRSALKWLKEGHIIVLFPAGSVSHFQLKEKAVLDSSWSKLPITLSQKSRAPIIPACCHTRNSLFFQIAGFIHPFLRTLLLPRAFKFHCNKKMPVYFGTPIPHSVFIKHSPKILSDWLRRLTYTLPYQNWTKAKIHNQRTSRNLKPILDSNNNLNYLNNLLKEIKSIENSDSKTILHQYKHYTCYGVLGSKLNHLMTEIGRAREETFRAAGEGTGEPIDIDQFDSDYIQLFIWDHHLNQIVGGYRVGFIDDIIKHKSLDHIYISQFYQNLDKIIPIDHKTVEIGRSFIRPYYQGQYQPLFILWQGIGKLLLQHPNYRYTLGLVSLSQDSFSAFAQRFLIACLKQGPYKGLNHGTIPKQPYNLEKQLPKPFLNLAKLPLSFNLIKHTIECIENKSMQLPILLKHYCQQLGSKCISFSLDPDFGDSVDILILTDLAHTQYEKLSKYMGKETTEIFQSQFK